jgi:Spy/CpxP family protein refolding chaperone
MFRCSFLALFIALSSMSRLSLADPVRTDPIIENYFPADLLINHAQEIGINDQQKQAIESKVHEDRKQFLELQQNLQRQIAALGGILRQDRPDQQEALTQLDKVLAAERDIKRMQLTFSLAIRNQLTPEQFAKAKELRQRYFAEGHGGQAFEGIRLKMQRLQERIRQLQAEGRDASAELQASQQCKQLMQEGKPGEADAVLHRALSTTQSDQSSDKK